MQYGQGYEFANEANSFEFQARARRRRARRRSLRHRDGAAARAPPAAAAATRRRPRRRRRRRRRAAVAAAGAAAGTAAGASAPGKPRRPAATSGSAGGWRCRWRSLGCRAAAARRSRRRWCGGATRGCCSTSTPTTNFWYSTKQAQRWLLTPLTSATTAAATSAPAAAPAHAGSTAGGGRPRRLRDRGVLVPRRAPPGALMRSARPQPSQRITASVDVEDLFLEKSDARSKWTAGRRCSTAAPGPVSFLGWQRATDMDLLLPASPDALLKALDGPVVKYVRLPCSRWLGQIVALVFCGLQDRTSDRGRGAAAAAAARGRTVVVLARVSAFRGTRARACARQEEKMARLASRPSRRRRLLLAALVAPAQQAPASGSR